jgi:hypothetical protein
MTDSTPSLFYRFERWHIIGVLLALLALLLPGCSSVKLAYNNAPDIGYWWLDSYLDFNSEQSLKVRANLNTLQTWHRQNELPAYVNTLEKLQRLAPANVSPAQLCEVYADVKPRLQALLNQAEPSLVALVPTLSAGQIQHLARQLEKRRQKWREEWLDGTPQERSARRVKQWVDRAEGFYGALDEPQLATLRTSVSGALFDANTYYRESQRRHQDTLNTLRQLQASPPGAASVKASLLALLNRSLDSPDTAYRLYAEKITQENCKIMASLHNSSTPAQRLKLMDTLRDYANDARTLMDSGR